MSIIQDALKKAQGEYTEKKMPVDEEVVLPKIEVQVEQKIKKTTLMRLPALVSILAILLLIYGLRSSLQYAGTHGKGMKISKKSEAAAMATPSAAGKAGSSFSPPKLDMANFMTPRPFILSGIMYVENKPQAIINGHVLEEGDMINGATILIIEKDCVLLDLKDTNIRLEVGK